MRTFNKNSIIIIGSTILCFLFFSFSIANVANKKLRIVSTFKPATILLFSLGLEKNIVGIDTSSKKDVFLNQIHPDIKKAKAVGSKSIGLNLETIISLKPDIVVLYTQKGGKSLQKKLAKLKINSVIIFPESFDKIKESLKILADASNRVARYEKVVSKIDEILNLIKVKTTHINLKKSAYYLSPIDVFNTSAGNMLQSEIIEKAGLKNVSKNMRGYFQNISPEQLIVWNPEIIIASSRSYKKASKIFERKEFYSIKAVRDKKIYKIPSELIAWDFPSPLSILASIWLSQKAYPENFKDIDIKKITDDFYKLCFQTLAK